MGKKSGECIAGGAQAVQEVGHLPRLLLLAQADAASQAAEPKAEQSLIIERLIKSRNHDMAGTKKISNHTSELNFGFQSRYYNDVCIISSHNQHIFSVI